MWFEAWSETKQRAYYVNSSSKETSWSPPPTFISTEEGYDQVAQLQNRDDVIRHTEALRKASNAAKRDLITKGVAMVTKGSSSLTVLDVASGKGGDLWKWRDTNAVSRYIGIDSSMYSVDEARSRAEKVEDLSACFEVLDARRDVAWQEVFGTTFDVISVQFALHYFFSAEKTALQFFKRAHAACAPGGVMLATFPSCDAVLSILSGQRSAPKNMTLEAPGVRLRSDKPIPYRFTLTGSVECLTEFTIPFEMLERVCESAGWTPNHVGSFNEIYHAYIFKRN